MHNLCDVINRRKYSPNNAHVYKNINTDVKIMPSQGIQYSRHNKSLLVAQQGKTKEKAKGGQNAVLYPKPMKIGPPHKKITIEIIS